MHLEMTQIFLNGNACRETLESDPMFGKHLNVSLSNKEILDTGLTAFKSTVLGISWNISESDKQGEKREM